MIPSKTLPTYLLVVLRNDDIQEYSDESSGATPSWWSRTAKERAADAFVVATRTADRPHGPGRCSTSQCAAERRPTGTEDRHQDRGGGARDVLNATATTTSSARSHHRHAVAVTSSGPLLREGRYTKNWARVTWSTLVFQQSKSRRCRLFQFLDMVLDIPVVL